MSVRRTAWILLALLSTGCESAVAVPEGDGSSTGRPAGSTGASTTAPNATSDALPSSTSTTGMGDRDSGGASSDSDPSEADGGGCPFLCDPDGGWPAYACSLWDQDCRPGEKCAPWANDGGSAWNALRCVPIDPNPAAPGEPCTAESNGVSGIDSCALRSMCWDIDEKSGEGTCVPHCVGSESAAYCADPQRYCSIGGEGVLTLCLGLCDPVASEPCPASEGCYPIDNAFICAPDISEDGGGLFEACEFTNACDAGLICANSEVGGELCDPETPGCCLPACDLNDASCPPMTACTPWYQGGDAPPGLEHIGLCVAEGA